MKDVDFKGATLKDLEFIKKLFEEGVKAGHYKKEILDGKSIEYLIKGEKNLLDNSVPQSTICCYKGKDIGFLIMSSRSGRLVEFHYFSLLKKYRNKGFGNIVIKKIQSMYNKMNNDNPPIFMSRCSDNSLTMKKIFEKNGFSKIEGSEKGWTSYFKCKDKKLESELLLEMNSEI